MRWKRNTQKAQLLKSSPPENDSHEISFHQNFFLVTSSLYFRLNAVCVPLRHLFRRRASRHDTRKHFWENSLIIIFLWALRETGPSNNKTKLFFASLYCFRYLEMIFHDTWILYAMSFPCNLLFTTCSAAHTNPRATKTEEGIVDNIHHSLRRRCAVQFHRCLFSAMKLSHFTGRSWICFHESLSYLGRWYVFTTLSLWWFRTPKVALCWA